MQKLFIFGLQEIEQSIRRARPFRPTLDHSVFFIDGSNHSYQRALHCFGVFRTSKEEIRALRTVSNVIYRGQETVPLVLAILGNGSFENLILCVLDEC